MNPQVLRSERVYLNAMANTRFTIARAASGANRPPVWRFLFTHQFENDASLAAYRAFHTAELYFVFGNVQTATTAPAYTPTPAELAFAEQTMGYWSPFAATGDPNGAGATVAAVRREHGRHAANR